MSKIKESRQDKLIVDADNKIIYSLYTVDKSRSPVKRLDLILDTGAFITVLRKDRAELNNYPIIKEKGCIIAGFSEKGIVCDLRLIDKVVFCGFEVNKVIVATPHENSVPVSEVLGMNILENFKLTLDFDNGQLETSLRKTFVSRKPKYSSGEIHMIRLG